MYGSPAMSSDLNLPFPANPFEQSKDDSDLRRTHQDINSGLLRYRSSPVAAFEEVLEFLPNRSSNPETESMFARFMGDKPRAAEAAVAGGFDSSGRPPVPFQTTLETGAGLVRHSSSPAGLFSHLNVENGFGGIRSKGGFRSTGGSAASNAEVGTSSGRFRGPFNFSSRQGSGGLMSHISEIGDGNGPEEDAAGANGGGRGGRGYVSGFSATSWAEDSGLLLDSFSNGKRSEEMRNHGQRIMHQFSLPKTSSEMAVMERFLHFQDAVPWKIRAKRGCATHPRSIAERICTCRGRCFAIIYGFICKLR